MTEYYSMDSSTWLAYFLEESQKAKEYVEGESIKFTSAISLFEIKRKLLKLKIDEARIKTTLDFVKKNSIIVELTRGICEDAAELSHEFQLSAIDSLIYCSSLKNESLLITRDSDFQGLRKAIVI